MQKSSVKVISDVRECGELWNRFSPKKSVFDEWDFRKSFVEGFKYELFFLHVDDKDGKGLLPLWHNTDEKQYEFVGGDWPEDNTIFASSSAAVQKLISAAPTPLVLNALLKNNMTDALSSLGDLKQDDDLKYVLSTEGIETFDQLLLKFSKKHRYNLKYDYKKVLEQNPEIIWDDKNDPSYFDEYVKLKYVVFNDDGKDENYYALPARREAFRQIIMNAKSYSIKTLQIKINGKLAGIDIVIIYKGQYYLIGGAYDVKNFSGVGTAALYLLFEDAIKNNVKLIDCLQEESGWKHRYFEGRPVYVFKKD